MHLLLLLQQLSAKKGTGRVERLEFMSPPTMESKSKRIRVAVVDDDPKWISSLRGRIDDEDGIECVSFFTDAAMAVEKLPEICPDVVLVDLQMPAMTGVELIQKLQPMLRQTQWIVLTSHSDHENVFNALKAGATGYVLKRSQLEEIIQSIYEVKSGGSPMSSSIARMVVQSFKSSDPKRASEPKEGKSMSPREEEILKLLASGYFYKEIADQLDISQHTVRTHLRRIYEKLQVRTRTEAVVRYLNQ